MVLQIYLAVLYLLHIVRDDGYSSDSWPPNCCHCYVLCKLLEPVLWFPHPQATNSNMVEVVLLGFSSVLDTIWALWPLKWVTRLLLLRYLDKGFLIAKLPIVPFGLWIWFPWSSYCGPYWLCPHFLLCLCLWHQIAQLPKEVKKRTQASTIIRFWLSNQSSRKIWLALYFIFTNFVNQHPVNDTLF